MFLLLKYTLLYTVVLMMVALGRMFSLSAAALSTSRWKALWSSAA